MSARIFDTPAPRLFTLPPQDDFLRTVARTLRAEFDAAGQQGFDAIDERLQSFLCFFKYFSFLPKRIVSTFYYIKKKP